MVPKWPWSVFVPVSGGQGDDVKVYHLHTPFNPLESSHGQQGKPTHKTTKYTLLTSLLKYSILIWPLTSAVQTGGKVNLGLEPTDGKPKYVSYDTALGRNPGMTTCTSCQQQVMTNVTYKAGTYAWLMCLLFICCGWVPGWGRRSLSTASFMSCVAGEPSGLTDSFKCALLCCRLVLCCCLIPFFMNNFKDAYHTCPRCNRVLHVEKKKCCKW